MVIKILNQINKTADLDGGRLKAGKSFINTFVKAPFQRWEPEINTVCPEFPISRDESLFCV